MERTTTTPPSRTIAVMKIFARRKTQEEEGDQGGTKLARVLGLWDLIMLGVGSTLGLGVYVLAGAVAKSVAGPAVTLSFLIAAIASAMAGLCYAEFAARVPKAGSAYVYSYVTVGELAAFVIGWNLILEYVIGAASVARGLSDYIDSLTGNVMSKALTQALPLHVSWLSPFPDFLSFVVLILVSFLIAWGVKESSFLNNIFTGVNLLTVALVVVAGSFYINTDNWFLAKDDIPAGDNGGDGGFFPFGFSGVMAGAAKCFYGFVGFDCVATTGEEAKQPKRDIPLSIMISLVVIFLAYFSTACILTLMWPYYLQDANAPLPYVFGEVGLHVVKYIVSVGAIAALCTNIIGCLFPIPRVVYAMGTDRLLFSRLAAVHPRTHTPVLAIMLGGLISGVMAALFDLDQLINMMSIGTLLAYTIVAICVLIIRYRTPSPAMSDIDRTMTLSPGDVLNFYSTRTPDRVTEVLASWSLAVYIMFTVVLCVFLESGELLLAAGDPWVVLTVSVILLVMLIAFLILCRQPQARADISFKVPFVPLVPCASILINFYLMAKLDINTWIRFTVWLFVGLLIYVFYSIPNSREGMRIRRAAEETKARQELKLSNKTYVSSH